MSTALHGSNDTTEAKKTVPRTLNVPERLTEQKMLQAP